MSTLWATVRRVWPSMAIVTAAVLILTAPDALADIGWDIKNALWGQSNPALTPFIQFTDNHGINVWHYELSIDRGHPITGPDKWFWSKILDPAWQLYRDIVLVGIWLVNWVYSFGWIPPIADASITLNHALSQVVQQMGLVSLFLFIAGAVGLWYIVRGKVATGVWEITLGVVIVAGLGTFLANPAGMILSPNTGAVYQVRDASLEFVTALSSEPNQGGQAQIDAVTSSMIETFIRQPLQLANYGVVLDGGPCEKVYDDVLKAGPYAWGSEIRDKVNGCNNKLGEYAGNPSPSMVTTLLLMYPGSFIVMALAVVIAGGVLKSGIQACYLVVKAAVTSLIGVLPGAARRPFWGTIADLLIAGGVFLFSFVWLAVFLNVVRFVLGGSTDMPSTQRILMVDILLVVGLILFLLNRKRIEQSSHKLRELLASRPGGGVGTGSPPPKLNTAMAVGAAANVAHLASSLWKRKPTPKAGPQPVKPSTYPLGIGTGGFVGGGFNPPRPIPDFDPGPEPRPGGGGGRKMLEAGANIALAHLTGGTSKLAGVAFQVLRHAPKPRPQLPAGGGGTNPALRPSGGGPLPSGRRRILELPPGPAAKKTPTGRPELPSAGPSSRQGTGQPPTPTRRPAPNTTAGTWPTPASQRPPKRQSSGNQPQVRRPARRPQGPKGR